MNNLNRILLLSVVFFVASCSMKRKSGSDDVKGIKNLIKLGYECKYNEDSTLLLCMEDYQETKNIKQVIVVKPDDNSIVYKENMQFPKVKWVDSQVIEISRGLGILGQNNAREVFRVDLETMKKTIIDKESETR